MGSLLLSCQSALVKKSTGENRCNALLDQIHPNIFSKVRDTVASGAAIHGRPGIVGFGLHSAEAL